MCVCAQVRVCGVPGEVLCGEMVVLTVEVVNCGEVPLNSLRLTSSAAGRLLLLNTVSIITHNTPPVYASCMSYVTLSQKL